MPAEPHQELLVALAGPAVNAVLALILGAALAIAGASGLGLMDWANFLLKAYKSQQKGKFQNVPMTPEQKAIFGWAFNRLTNSPDTTKDLYGYSLSRAYASPKFDMAAAMQGKPSYTPPPNLSSAELAKLIGYWSAPPSTNAPPTGGG